MSAPCPTYGFHVAFAFRPSVAPEARDTVWEQWIDTVESRGLECGGGGDDHRHHYVVSSVAAQATDADRGAISAWLAERPELAEWSVGELVDLQTS
jgi:uncharacterized protein YggL (DUF469 family)